MAATYVIVTNLTTGTLSVSGDKGIPSVTISGIPGSKTANILMRDLLGNKILCEALSTWITAGTVSITRGGVSLGAADLTAYAQGSDMNRNTYDADDDGIVDSAESIAFDSVTAETALAVGDSFLLHDLSVNATRKFTVPNALNISVLTAETVLANDDSVLLYDLSATAVRKMTVANLLDPDPLAARATALLPADTLIVHDDALSVSGKVALGTLLDPNPLAAEVAIADDDEILIHDTSAVASRKMTVANFLARKVFQESHAQLGGAVSVVDYLFLAPAAGTIRGLVAISDTTADDTGGVDETLTCSVLINGVTAMTTDAVIDTAAGTASVLGVIDPLVADFVAGDVIAVERVYVPGDGAPALGAADTIISVWANVAL